MANPYIGANITGCNSPAIGNDRSTYGGVFDTAAQAIDNHDHTTGKGKPIGTGGIANGAVTAAQIAAGTITTTQIAAATIQGSNIAAATIAASNLVAKAVDAAHIADATITAAQIANGAVGLAQAAAPNRTISTSSGAFSVTNNAAADVTNLSCAITTTGNDVEISIIPAVFSVTPALLGPSSSNFFLSIFRDSTEIVRLNLPSAGMTLGARFLDFAPSAAAHTYKVQVNTNGNQTVFVTNCVLVVKEVK